MSSFPALIPTVERPEPSGSAAAGRTPEADPAELLADPPVVVRVVVATAEPFGAYHLAPLADVADEVGVSVCHLVPSTTGVQGPQRFDVTSHLGVVDSADVVVVTGGTLNAWTHAVVEAVQVREVPCVFSQLAWVGDRSYPNTLRWAAVTAGSGQAAGRVADMLEVPRQLVEVVGVASLGEIPRWTPKPDRALVLSLVSEEVPDGQQQLQRAAHMLQQAGWDVVVRCHPREDPGRWAGFTIDDSVSPQQAAADAAVVVGLPTTAFVPAAAVGVPIVSLPPQGAGTQIGGHIRRLATPCESAGEVVEVVADGPVPPDPQLVEQLTGPQPGAARRLLQVWQQVGSNPQHHL